MSRSIFICHRHDEEHIADVINKHLQLWGIPKKDIFQSSDAKGGAHIGATLDDELKKALSKANLLIFIYTHGVHDWSYCTWECGLATDLTRENTNIVVFECTRESPSMFQPRVRVRVTQDGIKQFTHQFHTEENFFANEPPFNPNYSDDILAEKTNQFYKDLVEVIPGGVYKETPLLHLIRLSLAHKDVEKVLEVKEPKDAHDYICEKLIIETASPYCPQHFGYSTFDEKMKWSDAVKRWVGEAKKAKAKASDSWVQDLHTEIWRAIHNKPARPTGEAIISVAESDRHYVPLLCLMREHPGGEVDFNVYFYRIS